MGSPPAKLAKSDSSMIAILGGAYLLLIALGAVALARPEISGRSAALTPDRAFFIAVNAATLCGFPATIRIADMAITGQTIVFGLVLGGAFLSLWIGGIAMRKIAGLEIASSAIAAIASAAIAAALLAGWGLFPDRGPADGMMLGVGALGNSGLVLSAAPTVGDWRLHAILLPLAVAGGVGVVVWVELFQWIKGRPISRHSRTILFMSALVYLFFLLSFWLVEWLSGGMEMVFRQQLPAASAASINSRSLGLPLDAVYSLPRTMQWLLMFAMMIGSAPGGTGGGLKLTMVSEPLRAWRRLRGGQPVNLSLSWAIGWAAIFMAILGVALLVLLALQPQTPADRLLFDAISALSLTGLTFNPISQTGPALYTLCILMLAGRLIPFALLHAQSRAATIPQVAVG
ncbi:MAG: hypothetical protein IT446_08265 [Phycisphaerales bacterium]|jgi:trk system potassium uptake protein TrkH|nr:hypothetical protein [Phycisphaerales bacterium]